MSGTPGPWGTDEDQPGLVYSDAAGYPGTVVAECPNHADALAIAAMMNATFERKVESVFLAPVHMATYEDKSSARTALCGDRNSPYGTETASRVTCHKCLEMMQ